MPRLFALAYLLVFLVVPTAMAEIVTEPLELETDFIPSVTFTESHSEKVVKTLVLPDPGNSGGSFPFDPNLEVYGVVPSRSTTASVTANIKGIVLADIDATTAFSLRLGGADIAFTLGDIPTYTKGQTTAFYCWNGWSPAKKALGTGGVKLTWTATKLTATVTMGNELDRPSAIGTNAFVGNETTPGTFPIKDVLTAEVSFGSVSTTVPRTVYFTGSYKVTHYRVGPVDDPVYETDLYTVTETGAADYTRPTVALTSPKQGASVGAAVDVQGTASDAKGLSKVEWTTSLNGSWTATDAFSISSSPEDGLWGATTAIWTVSLTNLPHGTTKLWVRSLDDSGNPSQPLLITLINPMPTLLTGRWDGLLVPVDAAGLRGAIRFVFLANGTYTGTLVLEGASYPFSGILLEDETINLSISRGKLHPVLLTGTIDTFSPEGLDDASINASLAIDGFREADFHAFRSPWSAANLAPALFAGRFHVSAASSFVTGPPGNSYAVVTTARNGVASATFTLADGSVATWSGVIGDLGKLPAFASLYVTLNRGVLVSAGSVSSLMTVDFAARTVGNTFMNWMRPAAFSDKQFPAGFDVSFGLSGKEYKAPAGIRIMGLTSASPTLTASWGGSGVTGIPSQTFTVNANNTLSIPVTADALKLSVAPSTGLWTGSFKLSGSAVLSSCKLLIVDKHAFGFWTAPAPTGSVEKRFGLIQVE